MWRALFCCLSLEQAVYLVLHPAGAFLLVDARGFLATTFLAVASEIAVADVARAFLARRADRCRTEARFDFRSLAHLLSFAALVIALVAELVMHDWALLAFRTELALVAAVVSRMRFPVLPVCLLIADIAIATRAA